MLYQATVCVPAGVRVPQLKKQSFKRSGINLLTSTRILASVIRYCLSKGRVEHNLSSRYQEDFVTRQAEERSSEVLQAVRDLEVRKILSS